MPALAQASSCTPPIGAPLRPTPPMVSSPDFDGNAALQRNDVGQHPLPLKCCFGALRPLGGRASEGQRGIGLAAGQFDIVRRRPIALEENTEPAGAIDDSNRCLDAALRPGPFQQSSRPCEPKRRARVSTCASPREGNITSTANAIAAANRNRMRTSLLQHVQHLRWRKRVARLRSTGTISRSHGEAAGRACVRCRRG